MLIVNYLAIIYLHCNFYFEGYQNKTALCALGYRVCSVKIHFVNYIAKT